MHGHGYAGGRRFEIADEGVFELPATRFAMSAAGVSLASTRPACISEMRSQRSPSFMKWVDTKMVTPSLRDRSTSRRQKWSRATGSTPEVGSSRMSISGLWITATASDRRWRMPSGSAPGCRVEIVRQPEAIDHFLHARRDAFGRQVEQLRVQHEVLPHA
jgi:hypothetical protein